MEPRRDPRLRVVGAEGRAFVLAGGRSKRFGEDKARHPVEGVPMVLRVASALAASGLSVCVVARDDRLADLGVPILVEPPGPVHPLSGVLAGLEAVGPGGSALFSPCDLPWLDSDSVLQLTSGDPPRVAQGQPLVAWLPGSWVEWVRTLRAAAAPARRLVSRAQEVELPDVALRNVNRVGDLR